jgi:acyl-CoA synthetase (NDP forming)
VEVFRDVIFRLAPLSDRDADEMLHGIRGVALLRGYRGRPGADLDALRDVLLRVSYLGDQIPELLELDLNPVIAFAPGKGCAIVDARARVGKKEVRGEG